MDDAVVFDASGTELTAKKAWFAQPMLRDATRWALDNGLLQTKCSSDDSAGAVSPKSGPGVKWRVMTLVGIHALASCSDPSPSDRQVAQTTVQRDQSNDLAELASELGVALPPGSRVLWLHREAGMDDMIRAKVRMTSEDFKALSNKLGFDARDMRPGPGRLGVDSGQWNPRSTAEIRSIQLPRSNARFLNLGVAEEGEAMTVFIMQHGT